MRSLPGAPRQGGVHGRGCRAAACALLLAVLAPAPAWAGRRVAIVIDTSGSMNSNDTPRYTVQLSKIISELIGADDRLMVVRLPQFETCSSGPDPSLAVSFDAADRGRFRHVVNSLITYGGGNTFATALHTAMAMLGRDPAQPRLLLMLADSGGLDACEAPLTAELSALRASGAMVAAVNLDSTAGAFEHNPAFNFTTAAENSERLVKAVAEVYQRFLGSSRVQTGPVAGAVKVVVDPFVEEAFLVVAADGPLQPLREGGGNPGAAAIELDLHGGGSTRGLDNVVRGYRIVQLKQPRPGTWTFVADGTGSSAGYMLLQTYSLALRRVGGGTVPVGRKARVELEVFDRLTGKTVKDPDFLSRLQITSEAGGAPSTLRDDGGGLDRTSGDGIYTYETTFEREGPVTIPFRLVGNGLDQRLPVKFDAVKSDWEITASIPGDAVVDTPVPVSVRLTPTAPGPSRSKVVS